MRPGTWRAYSKNAFFDGLVRWDSGWYAGLAEWGYQNLPNELGQRDTAFFPLYPLAIRAVMGGVRDPFLAGLLVANLAFLGALVFMYRLVAASFDREVARRAVLLLAVSPFGFFLGCLYSESLFLFFAVGAFYFGERQRWFFSGLFVAAAGATRVTGILVFVGVVILHAEQAEFCWRNRDPKALWLLLGVTGPLAHLGYLAWRFDDPFLFVRSQYALGWAASVTPTGALEALSTTFHPREFLRGEVRALGIVHLLSGGVCAGLCAYLGLKRGRWAYAIWGILTLLASLSLWRSLGRYTVVIFPQFMALALVVQKSAAYDIILCVSACFLALFQALFAHWVWIA